ncbi:MAG: hypothetical protein FJ225_04480 [Lentisphaerae bacterium]|nr:hypothetical protein [Lentisphaerota bacterium]
MTTRGLIPAVVLWGAVSSAAPAQIAGGRLQALVARARCYADLPRRAHKPDFRLARVRDWKYRKDHLWIMDGGQKIGLLNLSFGEIEMFRFFPPGGGVTVEYEMPAWHGWDTLQGPRISIVPQGTWTGRGRMIRLREEDGAPRAGSPGGEADGLTAGGEDEAVPGRGGRRAKAREPVETLRLRYTENRGGRTELVHDFTLHFNPALGYVWDCAFDLRMEESRKFEYANLLPNGVADSRDERKRYQKCLWTRRDGTLCYMYQNPRSMMQSFGGEWTGIPDDGGFVGFVAEADANPFLEIVHSEPRTVFITCSVWYDQHVVALAPERKGEDGLYRVTATYRFLSLPLPAAKELEDAARTTLPEPKGDGPMGFRQNIVNDFETLVPAGTLFNGCIWGHSAKHDATVGRSGGHSLRLNGGEHAGPVHGGPLLHVEEGKRYRFGAWVRTRGVTGGGVYLRIKPRENAADARQSGRLKGDNDWTRMEIVFTPARGQRFAIPGLVVDGPGTAWFDDIELAELP